jgi:prepilin-type N-terminal cleavage/methylation domain-containing protein
MSHCRWPVRPRRERGFTLVEAVIVIVLVGIMAALGGLMLTTAFRSYLLGRDISVADAHGRVAVERMVRELAAARSATAGDLNIGVANEIAFTDTGGTVIHYARAGNQLTRDENGGPARLLADNVTALTFTYWDRNGAATAVVANVYYVGVAFTVSTADYNGNLRTTVQPRNF